MPGIRAQPAARRAVSLVRSLPHRIPRRRDKVRPMDPVPGVSAPFRRIALSLSGGGYRAAAFHLGVLDILERIGLLRTVAVLSTVSGGTLTGCRYAVSAAEREPFDAFFSSMVEFLCATNVVARAFAALAATRRSDDARSLSVISAAADVYASEKFLGMRRFGLLLDARTHLEEISLNATELQSGVAFRFQASRNPGARIGNGNVWMDATLARDLRLADIAAASSCFPGAFEPMGFPQDFAFPSGAFDPARRRELSSRFPDLLPLMDGGIYDNQGIDGLLLADERSDAKADLFIVSDTQPRQRSLYTLRPPAVAKGPRLRTLYRAGQVAVVVLAVSAVALAIEFVRSVTRGTFGIAQVFTRLLPMVITAVLAGALPLAWRAVHGEVSKAAPSVSASFWSGVLSLRVSHALELVTVRLQSLVAITADVFMKRIRSLGYDRLLRNPAYTDRSVANLIYDLERGRAAGRPGLTPSDAQLDVVLRAEAVKTQLWFDHGLEDALDLIACGQSTTCFNLLDFIGDQPSLRRSALHDALEAIWSQLQNDPRSLASARLPRAPAQQHPRSADSTR